MIDYKKIADVMVIIEKHKGPGSVMNDLLEIIKNDEVLDPSQAGLVLTCLSRILSTYRLPKNRCGELFVRILETVATKTYSDIGLSDRLPPLEEDTREYIMGELIFYLVAEMQSIGVAHDILLQEMMADGWHLVPIVEPEPEPDPTVEDPPVEDPE